MTNACPDRLPLLSLPSNPRAENPLQAQHKTGAVMERRKVSKEPVASACHISTPSEQFRIAHRNTTITVVMLKHFLIVFLAGTAAVLAVKQQQGASGGSCETLPSTVHITKGIFKILRCAQCHLHWFDESILNRGVQRRRNSGENLRRRRWSGEM